ncbi:heat shock protein HspQ [Ochrobactrum chromiisoli]|uniref:Heat shock protein HspQ n=1 Tax=Ochrobactrum chromiisoli TaxID=2993941 RepID=A0ABT3QLL6_9HYPH|nr:heat shock protein HspQ [Ochrobactrum chromiisoli]MCX2696506.1 heat shock protein HspQ [Ochrobactrum chromiisoli]
MSIAPIKHAKFQIGQVVQHRLFPFRGIIFDVDPEFANTEEWYESIPEETRPRRDQPFYHLLAENSEAEYVAYVSEQNLIPDLSDEPLRHPMIVDLFDKLENGTYRVKLHAN